MFREFFREFVKDVKSDPWLWPPLAFLAGGFAIVIATLILWIQGKQ